MFAQIFQGFEDSDSLNTQAGVDALKDSLAGSGITGTTDVTELVIKYINFILPYLALALFVGFVYAGVLYVTAFGNEEATDKSKKIMLYSAIGIVIVILSFVFSELLTSDLVQGLNTPTQP